MPNKSEQSVLKTALHVRSKHRGSYQFQELIKVCPTLNQFVYVNDHGHESIDFFNPEAVKTLNQALLKYHYKINWDLPEGYLCPPVPGRADYIHYIADLLGSEQKSIIPKGKKVQCLEIGVGANCIYPLIGSRVYNWRFIGSEIDPDAISYAQKIIEQNPELKHKIKLRKQTEAKHIFMDIIEPEDIFDCTICNPPFYKSQAEANKASARKLNNLDPGQVKRKGLNFGGQANELWVEGGELAFIQQMITESISFSTNCLWFTSLVSKEANLPKFTRLLKQSNVIEIRTIPMAHGNKKSRILCWTFLTDKQRSKWAKLRWK